MNVRGGLERIALLQDVERRRRIVLAARAARRLRRRAYERLGSAKHSHPEIAGLHEHLDFDGGFFVEAGANDGHRQSNTYFLERFRGWRGLLVEPIPELYERCARERPRSQCVNCALVDHTQAESTITLRYDDLGSHVLGEYERGDVPGSTCWGWDQAYDVTVKTRTLDCLLDEMHAPQIDFLSLDVEGYEEVVLAGLDLDLHLPRLILIEAFHPEQRLERLEPIFARRYELIARPTPKDLLFRSRVSVASARPPQGS